MITADQLLCHLIGDYILQSHWMAANKGRDSLAALAHALMYSSVFGLLSPSPAAWSVIFVSHFLIDRYRLARYLVWAKNWMGPKGSNIGWVYCKKTGYPPDVPDWLAVWLLILADNCAHILINGLALKYL